MNRLQEFVRETAHEIRTPMNTVSVGFGVIKKELSESQMNSWRRHHSAFSNTAADRIVRGEGERKGEEGVAQCCRSPVDSTSLRSIMQMVDDTKASADIAVDLVSDLLLYDRLEEGALQLEKTRVRLWALVRDTLSLFKIEV